MPKASLPGAAGISLGITHLATRGDTAAKQLAAAWAGLATLPGPHLLAGDLNLPAARVASLGVARMLGDGPTFPAARPTRRIDHFLTDPWPTDARGLPLPAPAPDDPARRPAPGGPLLRAVAVGSRGFVVSDHSGTWIDLEPAA